MFAIVHGLSSVSISIIGMVSPNMTGNPHFCEIMASPPVVKIGLS
jgi:hypothetical protein